MLPAKQLRRGRQPQNTGLRNGSSVNRGGGRGSVRQLEMSFRKRLVALSLDGRHFQEGAQSSRLRGLEAERTN
eukprot:4914971-Pleurochrysis_carterae.AAC.1